MYISYESTRTFTQTRNIPELDGIQQCFEEETGGDIVIELVDDIFQIETNTFRIQFDLNDSIFDIQAIKTFQEGTGRKVLNAVHKFCDENGYSTIATDVDDTARGFWDTMGYQEGSTEGEYYRVI